MRTFTVCATDWGASAGTAERSRAASLAKGVPVIGARLRRRSFTERPIPLALQVDDQSDNQGDRTERGREYEVTQELGVAVEEWRFSPSSSEEGAAPLPGTRAI